MSAIEVVRKANAIEVATDGAEWWVETGVVCSILPKQFMPPLTPCGTLIAPIGWLPAASMFIVLAKECCDDFDEVRDSATEIWRGVEKNIPAKTKAELARAKVDYGIFFCGWSERHQRLEAFTIDPVESPDLWEIDFLLIAPGSNALLDDITAKLTADPEAFDPETDGVEIMETLRSCPKEFGQGSFSAVGGFVQATTVTAAGFYSRIVHRWPDRIGEPINLPPCSVAHTHRQPNGVRAAPNRAPDISAVAPARR